MFAFSFGIFYLQSSQRMITHPSLSSFICPNILDKDLDIFRFFGKRANSAK